MPTPRWMSQSASEEFSWSETLGGARGVAEAAAPGLIFVIVYVATHALVPTLIAASAVALLACAARLIQRQGTRQALSGFLGVAIGVVFAAVTGRGENYFAWGIATNVAMSLAFAASVLLRRDIVGGLYATLVGLPADWRRDRAHAKLRRRCGALTWMWAGLFALRVAAQAPLWAAGAVAALGVAKLALGLPLFAVGAWTTWWGLRGYAPADSSSESSESSGSGGATA